MFNFSRMRMRMTAAAALCALICSNAAIAATTIILGNTAPIALDDGMASPYPSTTLVSGIASNRVDRVEARLVRVVTKTADTNDGVCNADCSLREAIAAADAFDIIDFSELFEAPQTIVLGGNELLVDKSLSLKGPGAQLLTVSGNFSTRVLNVAAGTTVDISGISIADGNSTFSQGPGGGVNSSGNLTLREVSVLGNTSVADGGGVFNLGTMTISASTIADNWTRNHGGGVANGQQSTLTVVDSTVSRNSADEGGGIIQFSSGSTTLLRTTVSQNSVRRYGGGGLQRAGGSITLGSSIVAGNLKASSNAFANSADVFGNAGDGSGFTSIGHNLIGDLGTVAGVFTQTGDQAGSGGAVIAPRLGPLMLGGGSTPTHAPLSGSPAIDKGNAATAASDQRNQGRPFDTPGVPSASGGDGSDIGAVEMQTLIVANANDAGVGSLREALAQANADGESLDDIVFDATFFSTPRTIQLASALPAISSRVTLNGPGATLLDVRRGVAAGFRIFTMTEGQLSLSLSGMTVSNGRAPVDFGGGISSNSDLHLSDVAVTGNFSQSGGGVAVRNGNAVFSRSTFSGNEAEGGGGLFFGAQDGAARLRLELSTVSGNTSSVPGGGGILHATSSGASSLEVIGSVITRNGGFFGGAIATQTSAMGDRAETVFRNSIVVDNTSGFSSDVYSSGPGTGISASRGFNLSNDSGGLVFLSPTDLESATPLLGALAQNGGSTATHALLPGSPAIDKGERSGANFDQRAELRPYDLPTSANAAGGDGSDIGAFEFVPALFANGFE